MADKKLGTIPEDYYRATGKLLSELMGKTNIDIRTVFRGLNLREPTDTFLNYYRSLLKNPKELVPVINEAFAETVETKLGLINAHGMAVLDAIIVAGYSKLAENKEVTVPELLRALELKLKYPSGNEVKNVKKLLDEIYKKSNKDKERSVTMIDITPEKKKGESGNTE